MDAWVSKLVTFGGEPDFISDALVQTIRGRVNEMNTMSGRTFQNLKAGDEILIQFEPFTDYRSIFDAHLTGHERVRVLLQLLQDRQVRVNLFKSYIKPIKQISL